MQDTDSLDNRTLYAAPALALARAMPWRKARRTSSTGLCPPQRNSYMLSSRLASSKAGR
jgi:hypothetical protein